ncbi:MAG: U4/U6 snRNP-specific spliceosomal protein [Podila humilis]|nr:MAG: U4/U6 snRNP-specific spliceosomal protein [Podila humilis]
MDNTGKPAGERIHFGSLEVIEAKKREAAARLAAAAAASPAGTPPGTGTSTPSRGTTLDDLKIDDKYELTDNSKRARDQQMEILEMFERKKRARTLAVPTEDRKVREKLREMGEPVCLFGEDNMDRRARLRELMAKEAGTDGGDEKMASADEESGSDDDEEEEVYTPGTDSLLKARRAIAHFSLPRAAERVARQREENQIPVAVFKSVRAEEFEKLKSYTNYSSQFGDDRPLSQCTFSPDSNYLATGSVGGLCKIWSIPDSTLVHTLRGHTDKVGGIKWHPNAHISQDRGAVNLATGASDGIVNLWSLESDTPIKSLKGHENRVSRIAFHPMGRLLGSAAWDGTWRMWDIEAGTELITQRGHSREVYAIAFQCDGSLAATGGLDAIGRVWDLRTGRSALTMEGHVGDILGIDFSPNGYQIATGSADNSIRIWDLRTLRSIHSIPAHTNLVSDIKFYQGSPTEDDPQAKMHVDGEQARPSRSGLYLGSCSFDGTIKIWSADDWKLQKSLVGHTGKVTGLDISPNGRFLASSGFDRTFKLWAPEASDY